MDISTNLVYNNYVDNNMVPNQNKTTCVNQNGNDLFLYYACCIFNSLLLF